MNQMKCDRKSWEDIRIQVSLCKKNTFIGTTAMVKTIFCFATNMLVELEILLTLNSLALVFSICSGIPVPIFSDL